MEHGPIALLDKKVPVISIASPGEVFDKVISNAQEAKARDSYLIGIAPECNGTEIFDYLMKVLLLINGFHLYLIYYLYSC